MDSLAQRIKNDELSLDEKLAMIDEMVAQTKVQKDDVLHKDIPSVDPGNDGALICDGCA